MGDAAIIRRGRSGLGPRGGEAGDGDRANSYAAWQRMGSPQPPTVTLVKVSALAAVNGRPAPVPIAVPRQRVSLIAVTAK